MTTYQPGPSGWPTPSGQHPSFLQSKARGLKDCGCQLDRDADNRQVIVYCPTHAQAPAMLAALTALIYASDQCKGHTGCGHSMQPWKDARAILRAVEG